MNFYTFHLLSPIAQVYWALRYGTYSAQRWEEERGIKLYYCADGGRGFFVELAIDKVQGEIVVLRSFASGKPLEEYTQGIQLPE